MSLHEEDLPVLSSVVESGNPSIIQSTRLGNEVLRELETLRQDSARALRSVARHDTEVSVYATEATDESATLKQCDVVLTEATQVEVPQGLDIASINTNHRAINDDEIEIMIDDIVDRHITALRRDIKRLLDRARSSP